MTAPRVRMSALGHGFTRSVWRGAWRWARNYRACMSSFRDDERHATNPFAIMARQCLADREGES